MRFLLAGVIAFFALPVAAQESAELSSSDSPVKLDSLGDPLPQRALLRMGTRRFRPPSAVSDLALSPDGQAVVTVCDDLIAWDAATGKERWRIDAGRFEGVISGASYGVRVIAFANDDHRFFTTRLTNEIVSWSVQTGSHEVIPIIGSTLPPSEGRARCLDVTRDGELFALGSGSGVLVCKRDGKVVYTIANRHPGPLAINGDDRLLFGGPYSYCRLSPSGDVLAIVTSGAPKTLKILEAATGNQQREIELTDKLVRFEFSPDSRHIVTTERDSAVRMYDVADGRTVWSQVLKLTNPFENYTSAVAISPNGKMVAACATDRRIYLFAADSGQQLGTLEGHTWYPWAVAFSQDSQTLYSSGWDGSIRRWDVDVQQQLALPQGVHATGVVAMSPNGERIAFADDRGTLHLLNVTDGAELRTFMLPDTWYSQVTFSPGSEQLAAGGSGGDEIRVVVWDLASGDVAAQWAWPKGPDPHSQVEAIHFSPDGTRLAVAVFRQSKAYLFDVAAERQIAELVHGEVYGLSFHPDGNTLATAGWDRAVRFWNAHTGVSISAFDTEKHLSGVADVRMYNVSYDPRGRWLATAHLDGTLSFWDARDMSLRSRAEVNGRLVYGATCFSPDGLWFATGSARGNVELFDPATGRKVWDVGAHEDSVYTVGFGRNSSGLVSGGSDGVCYLWSLQSESHAAETADELWQAFSGEDPAPAYGARWKLLKSPQTTVELIADKLRPVKVVFDLDAIVDRNATPDMQRRKRLMKMLIEKEEKTESLAAVRRSIYLLAEINSEPAIALLQEFASGSQPEMSALATEALEYLE